MNNDYYELISDKYGIKKDRKENENNYHARLLYSFMGKMGLVSLFDCDDLTMLNYNNSKSIVHFKKRISEVFDNYSMLYPDIRKIMCLESVKYTEEIYSVYENIGAFYHTSKRMIPAIEVRKTFHGIELIRGGNVLLKSNMSGLGRYCVLNDKSGSIEQIMEMFGIENISLVEKWKNIKKDMIWSKIKVSSSAQFLNVEKRKGEKYWKYEADTNGYISLMREGLKGDYTYYFYKWIDGNILASVVPKWMIENKLDYLIFANCILKERGYMKPIMIYRSNELVYIRQPYLLPKELLYFLKLYSWPSLKIDKISEFDRMIAKDIYPIFERIFDIIGIEVEEYVEWSKFNT